MVEALIEQAAWLTPTSLFLLLNVVIATILVSSAFHKKPLPGGGQDLSSSAPPSFNPPQPLARSPSLFSRVASFNFSNYDSDQQQHHHHQQHHHSSPSFFSRVTSFNFSGRPDEPGSDENLTREKNQDPEPEPKQEVMTTDVSQSHVTSKTEGRTVVRAASLLSRVASFTIGARAPAVEVDEGNGKNSESSENGSGGKKLGNQEEKGRVKGVKKSVKKKKAVGNNGTTAFSRAEEEVDTKADDFINRFKQQLKLQRLDSLLRCRST